MSLKHTEHRSHSHHHPVANRLQVSKRRSSRMSLNASVGLSGEDRQKSSFTIRAKATNLNRHGAAVHLSRELQIGSVVTLKNQRGAEVTARVVAQLAIIGGVSTYGLEFVEHNEKSQQFWGINFPSSVQNA